MKLLINLALLLLVAAAVAVSGGDSTDDIIHGDDHLSTEDRDHDDADADDDLYKWFDNLFADDNGEPTDDYVVDELVTLPDTPETREYLKTLRRWPSS